MASNETVGEDAILTENQQWFERIKFMYGPKVRAACERILREDPSFSLLKLAGEVKEVDKIQSAFDELARERVAAAEA